MPQDPFESVSDSLIAPAEFCFAIIPDDGIDIDRATKAIYIGSGGDIALQLLGTNAPVTFRNVPAGTVIDVRVARVWAAGTTATDIVGLA